ncbi:MAG TPA: hypothetical protein VHE55_14555 [Fimbriimonadaceae bacterium]|nr:hypothetical protein [Fimbriimonadaceae bacterium]
MVTLMLGLLASQAQVPKLETRPAFFVYFTPGFGPGLGRNEFEVAIWADGKVIWRDKLPIWQRKNGKWAILASDYVEANVGPAKVRAALDRIETAGAFRMDRQGEQWVDSSYTTIQVLDGRRKLRLYASVEPTHTPSPPWAKAWVLVRKEVKSLIPKAGKHRKRPDDTLWKLPE